MRKKPFTLLELSAAMAVLVIFMLFIMRFFNTSQDVMNRSMGKTDQYERARIIMDLLSYDLQDIFYSEGVDQTVYHQTDSSGSDPVTEMLSFNVLRPQTDKDTKTDLAFVTYKFLDGSDATSPYTLKMGIAGDDQAGKWKSTGLPDDDLGVLAEGVLRFRVVPCAINRSGNDSEIPPTSFSGSGRRIPDYVRIELQLLDSDTAAAIRQFKKMGSDLPNGMNPAHSDFTAKDKIRSFFRIVEIDRGQY